MSHFTAFVFWMRCIDLTTTSMRASWHVDSVLGARVIAGSRTGIVASLGSPTWGQGRPPRDMPYGLRPEGPGASCAETKGQ